MPPSQLESRLRYEFRNAELLRQAMTHRSHSATHNERLEFLGDSVLNCVVASLLFERFAKLDEGDLSRVRANLVKQQSLYELAQGLGIAEFLRLGEGELKSGGFRRPSILADTLEAIFGAVFLDAGFEAAQTVIRRLYTPILDHIDPRTLGKDAKTLLQEHLQGHKIALPQYTVIATHGAAHNQQFEVECSVAKLEIKVFGSGASRRAAEQAAAKKALDELQTLAPTLTTKAKRSKSARAAAKLAEEERGIQQALDLRAPPANRPPRADRGEKLDKPTDRGADKAVERTAADKPSDRPAAPKPVGERTTEKSADKLPAERADRFASDKGERAVATRAAPPDKPLSERHVALIHGAPDGARGDADKRATPQGDAAPGEAADAVPPSSREAVASDSLGVDPVRVPATGRAGA
ncbi:ribonuclease III [Pararobbsia silviterrae]|uniref:Ribonuclease 3 n=1 Tax=Pararobbsia silviterrae TaxID=1792498 RepID=A0A494Y357_9BURK|nr:ribonuclease III [Pararobbsia silviterrae]RKP56448.1 ribonuclease III [Pararobbsia silviterrae]